MTEPFAQVVIEKQSSSAADQFLELRWCLYMNVQAHRQTGNRKLRVASVFKGANAMTYILE